MQCVAALLPGGVTMPPPAEIPVELRSYYASLTLEPSDILSFGYQIASGMVSEETTTKLLVCVNSPASSTSLGVPDWTGYPAQGPGKQECPHDRRQVPESG